MRDTRSEGVSLLGEDKDVAQLIMICVWWVLRIDVSVDLEFWGIFNLFGDVVGIVWWREECLGLFCEGLFWSPDKSFGSVDFSIFEITPFSTSKTAWNIIKIEEYIFLIFLYLTWKKRIWP